MRCGCNQQNKFSNCTLGFILIENDPIPTVIQLAGSRNEQFPVSGWNLSIYNENENSVDDELLGC